MNVAFAKSEVLKGIHQRLVPDDDPALREVALDTVLEDVVEQTREESDPSSLFLQLGACSHWKRPHQTRWTASGGFAWPGGYLDGGLPELDWYVTYHRNELGEWLETSRFSGKRNLTLRVSIPVRTMRHNQAVIHTIWVPGTPRSRKNKLVRIYGFRKVEGRWKCVAES